MEPIPACLLRRVPLRGAHDGVESAEAPLPPPRGVYPRAHPSRRSIRSNPGENSQSISSRDQKAASTTRGHISHVTASPHPRNPPDHAPTIPHLYDFPRPSPLSLAIHPRVTPKSPPILFPPSLPRANRHWGRSERLATSVEALPSAMQESTQTTKASGRCAATPPAAPSLRGAPHWLPAPGGAGNRAEAAGLHALPRDNGGVCRLSVEGVVRRIECGVKNAYPLGEGPTSFRRTESSHFSSIRPSLILTAPAHQNAIGPLA